MQPMSKGNYGPNTQTSAAAALTHVSAQAENLYESALAVCEELALECPTCFATNLHQLQHQMSPFDVLSPTVAVLASGSLLKGALAAHRDLHGESAQFRELAVSVTRIISNFAAACSSARSYDSASHIENPSHAAINHVGRVELVGALRVSSDPLSAVIDAQPDSALNFLTASHVANIDPLCFERLAVSAGVPVTLLAQLGASPLGEAITAAITALGVSSVPRDGQ